MKKINTFLYALRNSLYNANYYKTVSKTKFSFSLKYLYFLLFIISLFYSYRIAYDIAKFIPKVPEVQQKIQKGLTNLYPQSLVVTIKNGEASTNVIQPYYIDLPKEWGIENTVEDSRKITHIITIDTNATIDTFESYNTAILLTKTNLVTLDNNKSASYKVYSLKDIKEDLIINRALYEEILIKITPYLAYMDVITYLLLGMFLLVFPFVFAFFSLIGKMLYLLFWTLFAVLISKIAKANLNYKKLYKMGLHALTLPILITFTLNLLNMSFPFLYTLIYIAFITYIISQYKNNKLKTYATKK